MVLFHNLEFKYKPDYVRFSLLIISNVKEKCSIDDGDIIIPSSRLYLNELNIMRRGARYEIILFEFVHPLDDVN